jgi:hypothetical protein
MAKRRVRRARRHNPRKRRTEAGGYLASGSGRVAKRAAVRARAARKAHRKPGRRIRHRRARYVTRTPRGLMRTYKVRNRHGKPLFHARGWRAHKKNPASGLLTCAIAVGVGTLVSVAASYVLDTVLSTQSTTIQTGFLVVLAGAACWFIPSAAVAAGVATGLLLIPAAKLVYSYIPSLVAPAPMFQLAASSTTPASTSTSGAMSALHNLKALHQRRMAALHAPVYSMAALRTGRYQALNFG